MKLYKYCKQEYNLMKSSTTIQLGTLDYFRENYKGEEDMIGDWDEGVSTFSDANNNTFHNFSSAYNCYIFCLSMGEVEQQSVTEDFGKDYNDFYTITDPQSFANDLCYLLEKNILLSDIDTEQIGVEFSELSLNEIRKIKVGYWFGDVEYVPNKIFGAFNSEEEMMKATIFHKQNKYKSQKEYRIALFLYHPKLGFLPVKKTPKIIDTRYLNNSLSLETPPFDRHIRSSGNHFINLRPSIKPN